MDNLHLFLIDDEPIDFNVLGEIVNDLAQPLEVIDNDGRRVIPKNEDFYEVTIPLYMDDLFKEHFRMSRATLEVSKIGNKLEQNESLKPVPQELTRIIGNAVVGLHKIPLEKKVLFTIWVISKPESFLAAGDRFGMARSTAHNIFREIIQVLRHLMAHYIRWPVDYATIQEVT